MVLTLQSCYNAIHLLLSNKQTIPFRSSFFRTSSITYIPFFIASSNPENYYYFCMSLQTKAVQDIFQVSESCFHILSMNLWTGGQSLPTQSNKSADRTKIFIHAPSWIQNHGPNVGAVEERGRLGSHGHLTSAVDCCGH